AGKLADCGMHYAVARSRPPFQLTDVAIRTPHTGTDGFCALAAGHPADKPLHPLLFSRGKKIGEEMSFQLFCVVSHHFLPRAAYPHKTAIVAADAEQIQIGVKEVIQLFLLLS